MLVRNELLKFLNIISMLLWKYNTSKSSIFWVQNALSHRLHHHLRRRSHHHLRRRLHRRPPPPWTPPPQTPRPKLMAMISLCKKYSKIKTWRHDWPVWWGRSGGGGVEALYGENWGWRVGGSGVDKALERQIFITLRDRTYKTMEIAKIMPYAYRYPT